MTAARIIDPKNLASDLRDKLGLSNSYASEIANGRRAPSLRLAVDIEQKLGIPPRHWLSGSLNSQESIPENETVGAGAKSEIVQ